MFAWIGDHFFGLLILGAGLYFGRDILEWIGSRGSKGAVVTAFCNKCGWKGKLATGKQSCGRCGSPKLTLRTG